MFKYSRYNFEGYHNLCTYDFEQKVYIVVGDYKHNVINSLSNKYAPKKSELSYDGKKIDDVINFISKNSSLILPSNNFIKYLNFKDNLKVAINLKELDLEISDSFSIVLEMLDCKKFESKMMNNLDYLVELKLSLAKCLILDTPIIYVVLNKDLEYRRDNQLFIDEVLKINEEYKKIIIILDDSRQINADNAIFLKYFQGYIANKI